MVKKKYRITRILKRTYVKDICAGQMKNLAARLPETTLQDHLENKETASEETESPGLDSWSLKLPQGPPVQSALLVRRITSTIHEGRRDDGGTKVSTQISAPENQKELTEAEAAIRIL